MIRQWYRRTTLLSAVLFWMCCKRPVFGIATVNKVCHRRRAGKGSLMPALERNSFTLTNTLPHGVDFTEGGRFIPPPTLPKTARPKALTDNIIQNNDFNARLPVDLTINTFVRDHVLTEAWSSPPTLADSPDYFEDLALATTSSPGTWDDHARILFIDSELATGRVFGLVSAMMLLAIAVGVIVGIVSGDVDAGTAVSGAVVGIVAVFAGFVFWSR